MATMLGKESGHFHVHIFKPLRLDHMFLKILDQPFFGGSTISLFADMKQFCVPSLSSAARFWEKNGLASVCLASVCLANGIVKNNSEPHQAAQNGRAERYVRILKEKTRTLRCAPSTPNPVEFWCCALEHAVELLNWTPRSYASPTKEWNTPADRYHQHHTKPIDSNLTRFTFGQVGYVLDSVRTKKPTSVSSQTVWLGRHNGQLHKVFEVATHKVILARTFEASNRQKFLMAEAWRSLGFHTVSELMTEDSRENASEPKMDDQGEVDDDVHREPTSDGRQGRISD
eukprot:TRINITY_DN9044_c0_g1_i1.p1 TRINITY_DN9044_c0_g1~~TRINITY_DN9044_c0_g1_i1.p1  ORF type:complete len:286 (+),score=34.77 TRINITY_DN9044_c0_g1_i1:86-943(+)